MSAPDHLAADRARLVRFVLRARRIRAHSLCADMDELLRLSRVQIEMSRDAATGRVTVKRVLAPEEQVESLAARLRPILLSEESIHYDKVVNATSTLVRSIDPDLSVRIARQIGKPVKAAFARLDARKAKVLQGYAVSVHDPTTGDEVAGRASMTMLAEAWLYNDLVHADAKDHLSVALDHSLERRFEAAVGVFAELAVIVIRFLEVLEQLQKLGKINLPDHCFEEDVIVSSHILENEAQIFAAPVGSAPPSPGEAFGAEWEIYVPPAEAPEAD